LKAEQPDLAQMVLLQCLQLFIGIHHLVVIFYCSPHEPSRVHALPVLPICTRLHLPSHGHSHLSKQQPWNVVRCKLSTSDAKSAPAGKADAVQAEFAKAGISAEVSQKVLKQYKTYLN